MNEEQIANKLLNVGEEIMKAFEKMLLEILATTDTIKHGQLTVAASIISGRDGFVTSFPEGQRDHYLKFTGRLNAERIPFITFTADNKNYVVYREKDLELVQGITNEMNLSLARDVINRNSLSEKVVDAFNSR